MVSEQFVRIACASVRKTRDMGDITSYDMKQKIAPFLYTVKWSATNIPETYFLSSSIEIYPISCGLPPSTNVVAFTIAYIPQLTLSVFACYNAGGMNRHFFFPYILFIICFWDLVGFFPGEYKLL